MAEMNFQTRPSPKSPGFITFDSGIDDDHPCSIKARINPKLFVGIKDYLSAASAENLEGVEEHFNLEAAKISPLLGYIPNHFHRPLKSYKDRLLPFNEETTRFASLPADEPDRNTFILTSDSININCYYKYNQLRDHFMDCPNIRDAIDLFSEMLSDDTSASIINTYLDKIIRRGDYYLMDEAVKKIQSNHFTPKRENRLIATLKDIDMCGGTANTKASLGNPEVREDFRRSMRELANIRINPVTIPEKYGITHIPNLLDAYYNKLAEERGKKCEAEMKMEILEDFFSEKRPKHLRRRILG